MGRGVHDGIQTHRGRMVMNGTKFIRKFDKDRIEPRDNFKPSEFDMALDTEEK